LAPFDHELSASVAQLAQRQTKFPAIATKEAHPKRSKVIEKYTKKPAHTHKLATNPLKTLFT